MSGMEAIALPKAEYDALLNRLEGAKDALTVKRFGTAVGQQGWENATKNYLPVELVERRLKGEHPISIWSEQRKLTLRALSDRAYVPAS